MTGAPGEKKLTTLLAVNEDLGVSTHSLRQGIVGTNIRASSGVKQLRVSCLENFKAGALRQNVGKITIIHLKDPRR